MKWFVPEVKKALFGVRKIGYKQTPILINNYNRLEMLQTLIRGLEERGYHNLHIIDNHSTYPPLLEYYTTRCPYPVHLLNRNIGHLAIWETGIYKQFTDSYFAYTDSDLEIDPACPDDFVERFISLLKKHPKALKAGFSIHIDDLPDHFDRKELVCGWERQFWEQEIEANVFKAPIDTTFAVYKPYFKGEIIDVQRLYLRVGPPYSVRHLPWYVDSQNPSDEEQYYLSHLQTLTHWSVQAKPKTSATATE